MHGDVKAVSDLGFDGLKLDSCGPSQDLRLWSKLLNATGKHIVFQNCFTITGFLITSGRSSLTLRPVLTMPSDTNRDLCCILQASISC
jgi:hypothetical protein